MDETNVKIISVSRRIKDIQSNMSKALKGKKRSKLSYKKYVDNEVKLNALQHYKENLKNDYKPRSETYAKIN